MFDANRNLLFALGALLAAATLLACGSDDPEPLDLDDWRARVAPICSDGTREAVALPLPDSRRRLGEDAAARSEIVRDVHDGILALGLPEGSEDAARAYLEQLAADAELLDEIAAAAQAGEGVRELQTRLDESAGRLALELGLDECAGFANAIARTP